MKDLYDAARHLVWLTQFGLSVVLPPVLFLLGAVWLRKQFGLGGWVILVGFALGMVAAIGSLRSSLKTIERQGRAPKKKQEPPPISFTSTSPATGMIWHCFYLNWFESFWCLQYISFNQH